MPEQVLLRGFPCQPLLGCSVELSSLASCLSHNLPSTLAPSACTGEPHDLEKL